MLLMLPPALVPHHNAVLHGHPAQLERLEKLRDSRVLIANKCGACRRVLKRCEVGYLFSASALHLRGQSSSLHLEQHGFLPKGQSVSYIKYRQQVHTVMMLLHDLLVDVVMGRHFVVL